MKKILLLLLLFQLTVIGFSQEKSSKKKLSKKKLEKKYTLETPFQKGYIKYYTKCTDEIGDVDSLKQMNNNPIAYRVYQGDLFKRKELKNINDGNNFDAKIYKIQSNRLYFIAYTAANKLKRLYVGDEKIVIWIENTNRDPKSTCAFNEDFFEALGQKLRKSNKEIAEELKRNKQELDNIKQDTLMYHEQLRVYQVTKKYYEDSIEILKADKEKLKRRIDDINGRTDKFKEWAREKGEIINNSYTVRCQIETNDNTDYFSLEVSNFGVGTPCNKDIRASTRTRLLYFIEGKNDLEKINRKAHLVIHIYGLADARGGDNTFKSKIDKEQLNRLEETEKNRLEFVEYNQIADFDMAKNIMDKRMESLKGKKTNIITELKNTKKHLNNKILGYLRAYCASDEATTVIKKLPKDYNLKATCKLYSIRFKHYYKNRQLQNASSDYRSVHLRFGLDSLYKTYDKEIEQFNNKIKDIKAEIEKIDGYMTSCETDIEEREKVIREYNSLTRDKKNYLLRKGSIYNDITKILDNQPKNKFNP